MSEETAALVLAQEQNLAKLVNDLAPWFYRRLLNLPIKPNDVPEGSRVA